MGSTDTVWLHFSAENDLEWKGEGRQEIEKGPMVLVFNHWGLNRLGAGTPTSVRDVIRDTTPENADSYTLVGGIPREQFLKFTGGKLAI